MSCRGDGTDINKCAKYCNEHVFVVPCAVCQQPMDNTAARSECVGPYHLGCAGYPFCVCAVSHGGDCKSEKEANE